MEKAIGSIKTREYPGRIDTNNQMSILGMSYAPCTSDTYGLAQMDIISSCADHTKAAIINLAHSCYGAKESVDDSFLGAIDQVIDDLPEIGVYKATFTLINHLFSTRMLEYKQIVDNLTIQAAVDVAGTILVNAFEDKHISTEPPTWDTGHADNELASYINYHRGLFLYGVKDPPEIPNASYTSAAEDIKQYVGSDDMDLVERIGWDKEYLFGAISVERSTVFMTAAILIELQRYKEAYSKSPNEVLPNTEYRAVQTFLDNANMNDFNPRLVSEESFSSKVKQGLLNVGYDLFIALMLATGRIDKKPERIEPRKELPKTQELHPLEQTIFFRGEENRVEVDLGSREPILEEILSHS